ncbi:hypothetical protein [Burkholderia gladioli]|uniref:hypothetical protein n=1 Tax=Burkholderia gladioli TaxID=28095 RepID=UPI0030178B77
MKMAARFLFRPLAWVALALIWLGALAKDPDRMKVLMETFRNSATALALLAGGFRITIAAALAGLDNHKFNMAVGMILVLTGMTLYLLILFSVMHRVHQSEFKRRGTKSIVMLSTIGYFNLFMLGTLTYLVGLGKN